jgi:replicative DNA helicase
MIDRVAPHDLEAEALILSACFLSQESLALISEHLRPEHFYSEANRRIFEGMIALSMRCEVPDMVSVAGYLRDEGRIAQCGGAAYLASLIECVPSVGNLDQHAERVSQFYRLRQLIATSQTIAAEGYGVRGDSVDAFLDDAESRIFALASDTQAKSAIAPMFDIANEACGALLAAEQRSDVELTTGLHALDEKLGGLGRGRLTVIAGRPGMGKTSLATGAVDALAAQGLAVALFSLEMPRKQIGLRMACCRSGASVFAALHGKLRGDERASVFAALDDLRSLPIFIDDTAALTLQQLRAKARLVRAKAGQPLALIVVDYLQLMSGPGRSHTREREVAEVTAGAKRLAKEMDCAVLLLSQLNRDCERNEDKRPRLSDLRESGAIEQDADDVVFVFREAAYKATEENRHRAELIIAKQRNGPVGTVEVNFSGTSTAFRD